ncbi:MAG: hypothetical protein ACYCSS_07695 [Sulfuriferula sp.]
MKRKRCTNSIETSKMNAASVALLVGLFGIPNAEAGQTFDMGNDQSLTLGLGLRTSYTNLQDGAPNGVSNSNTFALNDSRLYINGQFNNIVKGTLNTERNAAGDIVLMDGIGQLEFTKDFNVWMGRELPPSDRSNLDGPFYINVWQFPFVSQYPNVAIGRDDGLLAWGKPLGGKIVYTVGAFDGHNVVAGGSDASGNLLYAGRLAINFLDPEPAPAYYNASTYYGAKNILTLGLVYQYEKDGVGSSPTNTGDYSSWNTDLLFEEKVAGDGVVTVEGAYYHYGLGTADCNSGEPGSGVCATTGPNVGGLVAGKAYLATLEYLFPEVIGMGKFQPYVRYQNFERDLSHTTDKQTDLGLNYVINGHNALISAVYSKLSDNRLVPTLANRNQFIVGLQYQY